MTHRHFTYSLFALLALASAILAIEPLRWLLHSWREPAYASYGYLYILLLTGLIIWSVTSPKTSQSSSTPHQFFALCLLLLSALIRLVSQVVAINILGGLALAIDCYALLLLLNLQNRQRALSPFWLSVLFLFSLPLERVIQRLLGYPLQEISAAKACQILGLFYQDLSCHSVRIMLAGKDVLVDLPCSGTMSLMLSAAFFVTLSAIYRPSFFTSLLWGLAALLLSISGNVVRIILLTIGLAHQEALGIDVMLQPWHNLIGYFTLALSLLPLALFYKPARSSTPAKACRPLSLKGFHLSKPLQLSLALCFFAFALITIHLPRQALDVSKPVTPLTLPTQLAGEPGQKTKLQSVEEAYFKQYGGAAQKVQYGPLSLTLIQTTSPLRHLHAPDECLRGLGFKVTFQGTIFEPEPTAIYRATSPDGRAWRVAVSFRSNLEFTTSNVSAAVWHWLKHPHTRWVGVQRITPWSLAADDRSKLEHAAFAALDFTSPTPSTNGEEQ